MMTTTRTIEAFAEAGILAAHQGVLDRALVELALRLDLAGAGDLLTEITNETCWDATDQHDQCPRCGTVLKGTPNPHPKPPPPPPPPKPGK
jgi:hypothetical protein